MPDKSGQEQDGIVIRDEVQSFGKAARMTDKFRAKFSQPPTTLNDPAVVSRCVTFQSIHERLIL